MTDDLASLLAYNRWADARVLDACRQVAAERYGAEVLPGWPSLRSTIAHIAGAAEIWAARLAGRPIGAFRSEAEMPTPDDAAAVLDAAQGEIERFVAGRGAAGMGGILTYRSFAGDELSLPLWAAVRHVVNHGTYHRGQAAPKLRRLGVEPPATDLSRWAWEGGGTGG